MSEFVKNYIELKKRARRKETRRKRFTWLPDFGDGEILKILKVSFIGCTT